MDVLEKINRSFGAWYEGLFGGGGDDVRPKDVLRRIIAAMEDNRKEGFDNRIYVPNQYILEIAVDDEEEKDYLLSFLDRDELEAAIRRYCQQNHYHIRGALDFTVKELTADESALERKPEKLRVRCRYNTKITAPETSANAVVEAPAIPYEERTVAGFAGMNHSDEGGTVPAIAAATLIIYAPDKPPFRYAIAKGAIILGRSARSGNDVVLESDGQTSKQHARIELDADGKFTVYDLGSTNGTKVNGRRIENRTLHDGDEITLGQTRITFQQTQRGQAEAEAEIDVEDAKPRTTPGVYGGAAASLNPNEMGSSTPPRRVLTPRTARLMLLEGTEVVDDFLLASETVIGRGVTNDIVLPDRSIATRHARIVHNGEGYVIELLSDTSEGRLNGLPLLPHFPTGLRDNDSITLGTLKLRFEEGLQENR